MSHLTDRVLSCVLKVSIAVFGAVLATSLLLPPEAMAGVTCGDCATGQTACTYSCGTVVNCSRAPYTECGCVSCNACCIAVQ